MQKDYTQMMGQGAPTEQDLQELQMSDADFQEAGLPGGEGPEAIKERIITMLEQMGAMEGLQPAEQQEIMQLVDQLINDIEAGNFEAVEKNPIMELLAGAFEGAAGAEAGAPDMAGMAGMPPMPGGGM